MNKNWYAVYTHPRWEKKVAALLAQQAIEHYCPLQRSVRQWADRRKIIHEPFFPSYVFVRISTGEQGVVRQTSGVLNFVHWLGRPALIPDREMEELQDFLHRYDHVVIEKVALQINDAVEVVRGALQYRQGRVVGVLHHSVRVALPSLGCALVARVPLADVVKIKTAG